MKQNKIIFLSSLAGVLAISGITYQINLEAKAAASEWTSIGATLSDITDGVQLSGMGWGSRARTSELKLLDGFEFDYELTNVKTGTVAGFYFSTDTNRYMPLDGSSVSGLTFSINAGSLYYSGGQNRFAIFRTHALSGNDPHSYTQTTLSTPDGFGFYGGANDGTLVMNSHNSQKFHIKLDKADDSWYKITITEGIANTIWANHSNYSSGSVFTYVKASEIEMNGGKSYLYGFGFNGEQQDAPVINITNLTTKKEDTTPPVINLKKDSISTYAGLLPDETATAIDDVDGVVPITYNYPSGMLGDNNKLNKGNWSVTLTAKDKAGNVNNKTISYVVTDAIGRTMFHHVKIDEQGTGISLQQYSYKAGDKVWFETDKIVQGQTLEVTVKDSFGNIVEYGGTNPYYFTMPNDSVTITANSGDGYMNRNSLNVFNENFVYYLGRHVAVESGVFFSYSNSGFGLDIKSTAQENKISIKVKSETFFQDTGKPKETKQFVQMFVDGNRYGDRVEINDGVSTVDILTNLPVGEHYIELKKCNEAQYSTLVLQGISLENTQIKKHVDNRPLIEYYGDSISCGYGNLGSGTGFSLTTEDATQAYTNLAADALGFRSSSIAFSGIGLYRSWTHSEIIALTLYKQLNGKEYNMRKDPAKISVINLGTNDNTEYIYGISEAERPAFVAGMKKNLKIMMNTILNNNPDGSIIIAYDMMTEMSSAIVTAYNEAINEIKALYGTQKVFIKQFQRNEQGADGHPNLQGHINSANTLVQFIRDNNLDK